MLGRFFSSIVLQEQIDYRTNSRVTDIKLKNDSVILNINNQKQQEFDIVIMTGRPHQIHDLIPDVPMKVN